MGYRHLSHHRMLRECSEASTVAKLLVKISRDKDYNYFIRMIDDILKELNVTGAKGERLPYPMNLPKMSRKDNAPSRSNAENIVGQLMYGMVHTMVTIMYALSVLSR